MTTGDSVTLIGAASSDPDGDPLTFVWSFLSGPADVTLSDSSAVQPTFVPQVDGAYVFSLVVSDGASSSTASIVTVTASTVMANHPPIAVAGGDATGTTGFPVALDGSGSSDPDGDDLTYTWTLNPPQGSTAVLISPTAEQPTFIPDLGGVYVATLVVNDGSVNSSVLSTFSVTVNWRPVARAGSNLQVQTGTLVTLNGSGSSDADSDPLTYSWSIQTKPAGSAVVLNNTLAVQTTFTPDRGGSYVLALVVDDGQASSGFSTVTVTANSPPQALAGLDQSVATGSPVTLDGSASSDPEGDALTYFWSLAAPAGSQAQLSDPAVPQPTFTPDVDGNYVLTLVVRDGSLDSPPAVLTVTASTVVTNTPPVAQAGADQQVATRNLVTLDGSASSDPDGDPITYIWSFQTKPQGSLALLSNPAAPQPTFTADRAGDYVLTLVVSDGQVQSNPTSVTITATTPTYPGPCSVDDFLLPDTTDPLSTSTFTYQSGLLVKREQTGFSNRTTTYQYVGGDLVLEIVTDHDDPDGYEEKEYFYQGGRISRIQHVWVPNGPIEAISTYQYNEAPPQVVITYDDAVITDNERSLLDINDHGDVIREVVEFPVGTLESTSTFDYIYDTAGNILERNAVLDFSNGTSEEIRSTFDYSCWP